MELSEAWLRVLEKQREIRRQGNRQGKFSKATAALLRRGYEEKREFWNSGVFPGVCEREETFATRHADVPCRWFIPSSCPDPSVPIVYFHGGSYAVGSTRTHRRFLASLCESLKMNVLSVDYALSPDARYPVALEQIADVLTQLCAAPDAGSSAPAGRVSSPAGRVFPPVGARPPSASVSAVVPAGDSAGANLALAAALYAHNMSLPVNVRALLLFYGGYGFSAESPDSLSDADLQYLYWYLCGREVLLPGVLEPDRPAGSAPASAVAPAAASGADSSSPSPDLPSPDLPSLALPSAGPLHARRRAEVCSRINAVGAPYMRLCRQSFPASFAPALIVCAQADPLCQNSLRLFRLLRSCGVSARYYCQKGVGHEYLQYGKWLPEVMQTIAECKKFLTDS